MQIQNTIYSLQMIALSNEGLKIIFKSRYTQPKIDKNRKVESVSPSKTPRKLDTYA